MNTGLEDIQDGESSGMVVAVRIKPCDDSTTNFSIHSPGNNLLQVVTATRDDNSNIYQYDHVYWSTGTEYDQPYYASQEIIYNDIGSSLVQNTLKGFNCSLFAYGQTV